jgi:hypothetical protein
MININKDITVKILSREDLYDGMFIQSAGNDEYIYKIKYRNREYDLFSWFRISNNVLIPENNLSSFVGHIDIDSLINSSSFIETTHTIKLNSPYIRDAKLIELGI